MFEYWELGFSLFYTCYHEFMPLINLYLVVVFYSFLFFMDFNSGKRLLHILILWSNIVLLKISK